VAQDRPDRLAELIREFLRDERDPARRDPDRAAQPGATSGGHP
jgi:hypothetical protein